MHLQGADAYGASAAMHGASDTGFTVSGVFRDPADFAVLVLWDRDDFYGHPRFSYLPDGNFSGLKLEFDLHYEGLQPIDSPKFSSTDWPFINCLTTDGRSVQIRMVSDEPDATRPEGNHATRITGDYAKASATFGFDFSTAARGDKINIWYQNHFWSWTYLNDPGNPSATFAFWWQPDSTYYHYLRVDPTGGQPVREYGFQQGGRNGAQVASDLAALINTDPDVYATVSGNTVTVAMRPEKHWASLYASDGNASNSIYPNINAYPWQAAEDLANSINGDIDHWAFWGIQIGVTASWTGGGTFTVSATREGLDGNMIRLYSTRSGGAKLSPEAQNLSGGQADVTWRVTVDFDAITDFFHLPITDLQKVWMTFAPELANGAAYQATEWRATFTNWTVTDTTSGGARALKVAGPGSVRIEENDAWAKRSGYWEAAPTDGFTFWSQGRAIRSAYSAYETRTLTIETHCQSEHDVYVGTLLDRNCGKILASLDGGDPVELDTYAATRSKVRRKVFSSVPAGSHTVTLTCAEEKYPTSEGWYFYFDYLECAVLSDVPDAIETRTDVGAATDYDTDHTYKLSPQRLVWNMQKLGLAGEIDHYAGVFWWKQAKPGPTRSIPAVTITFSGSFTSGDGIFLRIGPEGTPEMGKSVFAEDTPASIAQHFAAYINETASGAWAQWNGDGSFTIHSRSANPLFRYDFGIRHDLSAGTITWNASDLKTGANEGDWSIDPDATPVFNCAFRDWHADYFSALESAGIGVVVAFSQELVNPPAAWVQQFADGTLVQTATGFGTLSSVHCNFSTAMRDYMTAAYKAMAGMMETAGLPARLQFGEVGWWFNAGGSPASMAYYDADTSAAAFAALGGRELASFTSSADDPAVNSYADADFLRGRLRDYVAAIRTAVLAEYPSAAFELLWPLDVNDPDRKPLNRYVNLPTEWQARSGSGFDTFVCEGFEYAGVRHNLNEAARCAAYPFAELSWDKAHCRYLMGIYYSGWPWQREYLAARRAGVALLKTWAYDHLCLFGWPLPLPRVQRGNAATI